MSSSSSSSKISFYSEYDVTDWNSSNAIPSNPKSKFSCDFLPSIDAFVCNNNVYSPTDNEVIKRLHCRRWRRRRRRSLQRWIYVEEKKEAKIRVEDSVVNDEDITCIDINDEDITFTDTIQDGKMKNNIPAKSNNMKTWRCSSQKFYRLFLYLMLYILFFSFPSCMAEQLDCCLPENAENGIGCTDEGTIVGGEKYLCVSINANDCLYCNKREDIDISQCTTGCVVAKYRYFCSGRFDPSTRHAVFGAPAAAQHATEIAQHPLGDTQLPQLRGTPMMEHEDQKIRE